LRIVASVCRGKPITFDQQHAHVIRRHRIADNVGRSALFLAELAYVRRKDNCGIAVK
jgi:hypothetical protein